MRFLPLFFLTALFSCAVTPDATIDAVVKDMGIGRFTQNPEAPGFRLATLDGATKDLASLKGQVVVVNFWASWCGPCQAEWPSLVALNQSLGTGSNVTFLSVDLSEPSATVKAFLGKNPASFPILLDSDGAVGGLYSIQSLPTTLVIDKKGRVVAGVTGQFAWDKPAIHDGLVKLASLP